MVKREEAHAAQTKTGKGPRVSRPTAAEVRANVPGSRRVDPKLLPPEVQHLANVSPAEEVHAERREGCFGQENGGDHDSQISGTPGAAKPPTGKLSL